MKKLGLALGSGGGRGVFHLGVLKALQENKIEPDIITGSSIGALVGGLWSVYQDYERILNVIKDDKILAIKALLDPSFFGNGLIKGESLEEVIESILGDKKIEELAIKFACVSCDLKTGKPFIWDKGSIKKAIRASMSIPGTFMPVEHYDYLLADGGIVLPVPDEIAKNMGAEVIISCNLDFRINDMLEEVDLDRVDKTTYRMLNIMRHYLAEYSMISSDIVLNPIIDDDGMISLDLILDKKRKENLIDLGYKMMNERIPELKILLAS